MIEPKDYILPQIRDLLEKDGLVKYYREIAKDLEIQTSISKEKNGLSVHVKMDSDFYFHCMCPTLERAIEYAETFEDFMRYLTLNKGRPQFEKT